MALPAAMERLASLEEAAMTPTETSPGLALKIEMHGATPRLYDILVMEGRGGQQ